MDFTHVTATKEDIPAIMELDRWAFPDPTPLKDLEHLPFPCPLERTRLVKVAGRDTPVAIHASYDFFDFRVPGAHTKVAGLTWVGVHPQFRRRGILTSMIDEHFARCAARGEALSALWAAEATIYGRFGYGIAARTLSLTIPRGAAMRPVPGLDEVDVRLETFDQDKHLGIIRQLHDSVDRPGWATRTTPEIDACLFADIPAWRPGVEIPRIAIAMRGDRPVGYARFGRTAPWTDSDIPSGKVRVRELIALDPATHAALWTVLTNLDLMSTTTIGGLPLDDPILHRLLDPRAAQAKLGDGVWMRVIDLPAAIAARRYQAPASFIMDVTDARIPTNAGRWAVEISPDGVGKAERTSQGADFSLDIRELGASYLGETGLSELASAGLIDVQDTSALRAASLALGWYEAPTCSWGF